MESDASAGLSVAPVAEFPRLVLSNAPARSADSRHESGAIRWQRLMLAAQPADYRRARWVFVAVLVALFLLVSLHGPCIQILYGHDTIGFLNSAWKVRHGILPHVDYHSALGALNPWILAAGMWVLGPTASVLPVCNAAVAVVLGLLAWTVARRRLPAFPALLFAFTQTVVAMSPQLLRFFWFAASYDGYYNRQGYALLSTLLLLLFLPRFAEKDPEPGARRDGRIAGAILGVLFFLKISYCMAGVGLCGLALILVQRFPRTWWWHALAAGAIVAVPCLALFRFDGLAMLRDLQLAAAVRPSNPDAAITVGRFLAKLPECSVEVALLAVAQLFLLPPWIFRRRAGQAGIAEGPAPSWLELAGVTGASMFICVTNSSGGYLSETPLLTSWLFVVLGCALRSGAGLRQPDPGGWFRRGLPVLCGLSAFLWAFTFGGALSCLLWSAWPWPTPWQQNALVNAPVLDAAPLKDLRIVGLGGSDPLPSTYAAKVNDGLALLRRFGGVHRVETLDFVNPFPFALRWPPSHGGSWCWDAGFSFSTQFHPTPEEAFGDADLLMIPKYPTSKRSFADLTAIYSPYITTHFQRAGESAQWYLLQRR